MGFWVTNSEVEIMVILALSLDCMRKMLSQFCRTQKEVGNEGDVFGSFSDVVGCACFRTGTFERSPGGSILQFLEHS